MSSFSSSPLVAEVLDSPHEAGDRAMNATVLTENGFTASVLGIHEAEIHVMSDTRVKVYCLSDLHVDTGSNLAWVTEHCRPLRSSPGANQEDVQHVFVCAGDVSASLDGLEAVFAHLVAHYDAVCFVPGNHDVWCKKTAYQGKNVEVVQTKSVSSATSAETPADSVQQLKAVLRLAERMGVHTGPLRICRRGSSSIDRSGPGDGEVEQETTTPPHTTGSSLRSRDLVIAPLYAWYHADWDTEPEITDFDYLKMQELMPFSSRWLDFTRCSWPEWIVSDSDFRSLRGSSRRLARAFASLNDAFLPALAAASQQGATVITFSHFVPRQDVSIEKRFLIEPMLTKVIGSCELETQIRHISPRLHLFGHTHIPIDVEVEGVRYVQWPLGYFREGTLQCEPVRRLNAPMMVYDSDLLIGGGGGGAVGCGGIPPSLPSSRVTWSARYAQPGSRTPDDVTPSPWLRDKINATLYPNY